ncbi:hypothetical protein FACS189425_09690 [Clostridia bacterium]|nr:hypothetical protein FACS189425_09690 [Clostridia bacterium]
MTLPYQPGYNDLANALNMMGFLKGDGYGYALDKNATRAEGLTVMGKLMGEEKNVNAFTGTHPFSDVPEWAKKWVGYAYQQGWTAGIGEGLFGANLDIKPHEYMTFLLKAMGYTSKDFTWDKSLEFAQSIGLLRQSEVNMMKNSAFKRDNMVYMSYYVLEGRCKDGRTLAERLVEQGAVSEAALTAARGTVTRARPGG